MASYNIILRPLNFARSWQKGNISIEGAIQITKPFYCFHQDFETHWISHWALDVLTATARRSELQPQPMPLEASKERWTEGGLNWITFGVNNLMEKRAWQMNAAMATNDLNLPYLQIWKNLTTWAKWRFRVTFLVSSMNLWTSHKCHPFVKLPRHEGTSQTLANFKICPASGRNGLVAAWAVMHCSVSVESKIWDGITSKI